MDHERLERLLRVWAAIAVSGGVVAILFGDRYVATVGIVAIIVGLISLMPALHSFVGEWEELDAVE